MSPPPLQGKQPLRQVCIPLESEVYDRLLAEQREIIERTGETVAIQVLARRALLKGMGL